MGAWLVTWEVPVTHMVASAPELLTLGNSPGHWEDVILRMSRSGDGIIFLSGQLNVTLLATSPNYVVHRCTSKMTPHGTEGLESTVLLPGPQMSQDLCQPDEMTTASLLPVSRYFPGLVTSRVASHWIHYFES